MPAKKMSANKPKIAAKKKTAMKGGPKKATKTIAKRASAAPTKAMKAPGSISLGKDLTAQAKEKAKAGGMRLNEYVKTVVAKDIGI